MGRSCRGSTTSYGTDHCLDWCRSEFGEPSAREPRRAPTRRGRGSLPTAKSRSRARSCSTPPQPLNEARRDLTRSRGPRSFTRQPEQGDLYSARRCRLGAQSRTDSAGLCVLQRISYSLLVAFCYRHLPPPTSGSEGLLSVVDLPRRPRTTSPPGVRMEGRGVARGAIPPVPRS